MNKEKKIAYLERTIRQLSSKLLSAENENRILTAENTSLRNMFERMEENIAELEHQMIASRDNYCSKLNDLIESKNRYEDETAKTILARKQYTKEVEALLKRMRNQK